MRTVLLPGIGGSDAEHWQTAWERDSPELHRFSPASWDEPDFEDWSAALDRAIAGETAILVAHSLGCLLAVRWAQEHPARVAGVFLVAAPDPAGPLFPPQAASFAAGLDAQVVVPAVLITSDDDPYSSPEHAATIARTWRIPIVSVGNRGHLNSASGIGSWSEGRNLLTAFTAGLSVPTR